MSVPRDIDLTLKMDFNKDERIPDSVRLPKETKDYSYKRYNEFKNEGTTSSTISPLWNFNDNFTPTISSTGWSSWPIVNKVEERVCWRKLYRDPRVFSESHTPEEWEEIFKNQNFPLGSKYDRAKVFAKLWEDTHDPWKNSCERCGKVLNRRNCLSYFYSLCQECNEILELQVSSLHF